MSIDAAVDVLLDTDPEIAGGRIFGVELPKSEADDMPRQAVVVSPAGGPEDVGFQQITTRPDRRPMLWRDCHRCSRGLYRCCASKTQVFL